MGRRGPAPKPTALRVLHGEKPYRINHAEPRPLLESPLRPDWLSPHATAEWDRITPDLEHMGVAWSVDSTALACYCESVARLRAALSVVAEYGLTVDGEDGRPVKNPAVAMARDASNDVRVWAREFGLTPASRVGLRSPSAPGSSDADPGRLLT
jgi:P27 family predicted phage terminase small subunit